MANHDEPTMSEPGFDRLGRASETRRGLHSDTEQVHRLATLGTLAASIAHEINNILTPVLGYAQLAKSEPGDVDLQAKALDRAIAGVEAASAIAEAMLGFARPSQPDKPARISDVLEAALTCLARKPEKDGLRLHTDVDSSLMVRMRPVSLQQVFINLLLNAFTALSGKRGDVYVSALPIDSTTTQITIADTGPGIPTEIECTLFEPFVTTDRSDAPRRGSGLGLAVCRQLVQAAGGMITVQTKLGQGTTFTLRLPTAESQTLASSDQHDRERSGRKAA